MEKRLTFDQFKTMYIKQTFELYPNGTLDDISDVELELAFDSYLDGEDFNDIIMSNNKQE